MPDDILKFLGLEEGQPSTPKGVVKAVRKAGVSNEDEHILDYLGLGQIRSSGTSDDPRPSVSPETGRPRVYIGGRQLDPREITPGQEVPSTPQSSLLQRVHEATDPLTIVPKIAGNTLQAIGKDALSGVEMAGSGISDPNQNWGPSFPSMDPSTWSGGRIAKTVGGTLGALLSPFTGASKALVTDPLTPVIGQDAAEKAGMFFPMGVGGSKAVVAAQPTTRGINKLIDMAGAENIPGMVQRARENPRLRLADVNDNLRVGGQGLVDVAQPNAMQAVVNSAKKSAAEAPDAVRAAYDTGMGPAPKVIEELERLKKRTQNVGQSQINPVLKSANPVDVTPVVKAIDDELFLGTGGSRMAPTALQQELANLKRKFTDGDTLLTDAGRLHKVQSDLRARASELQKSGSSSERLLGKELMDYRMRLVDAINTATPNNAYKKAQAKYRDATHVEEAFKDGMEILKNPAGVKGVYTRPEALERWMKSASKEEIDARRLAGRDAVEQKMSSMRFEARRGTDISDIEYNKRKFEILYGKAEADKMFKAMEAERDIALTNAKILHGSKTAETLAAQRALAVRPDAIPASGLPSWATALGVGTGALTSPSVGAAVGGGLVGLNAIRQGANKIGQKMDRSRNSAFANLIMSTGPERDAALAQLMAHPKIGNNNPFARIGPP